MAYQPDKWDRDPALIGQIMISMGKSTQEQVDKASLLQDIARELAKNNPDFKPPQLGAILSSDDPAAKGPDGKTAVDKITEEYARQHPGESIYGRMAEEYAKHYYSGGNTPTPEQIEQARKLLEGTKLDAEPKGKRGPDDPGDAERAFQVQKELRDTVDPVTGKKFGEMSPEERKAAEDRVRQTTREIGTRKFGEDAVDGRRGELRESEPHERGETASAFARSDQVLTFAPIHAETSTRGYESFLRLADERSGHIDSLLRPAETKQSSDRPEPPPETRQRHTG